MKRPEIRVRVHADRLVPSPEPGAARARVRSWLAVDELHPLGRWVPGEGEHGDTAPEGAFEFVFLASPTMRERLDIDREIVLLAGSEVKWVELRAEREYIGERVRALTLANLPEDARSVPVEDLPPEVWATAYRGVEARLRVAQDEIASLMRSYTFAAKWKVLAQVYPAGWGSVADVALKDRVLTALWECVERAWDDYELGGN